MIKKSDAQIEGVIEQLIHELNLESRILKVSDHYPEKKSVYVTMEEIDLYAPEGTSDYVREHPKHFFKCADSQIKDYVGEAADDQDLHFRVNELLKSRRKKIKGLREENLHDYVPIEGLVAKTTEVIPNLTSSVWMCFRCMDKTKKKIHDNKLQEPLECSSCGKSNNKTNFKLIKDECTYQDYQEIKLQDLPEELEGGEQPESIKCIVKEDIVGQLSPGDHVVMNCILKSNQRKQGASQQEMYAEAVSLDIKSTEYEQIDLDEEDIEKVKEITNEGDPYSKIVNSIAPSIGGMDRVKSGLALQLFGGCTKEMPDSTRTRGDLHIMMVGDPGTAKSQLIKYMSRISPRGIYSSGKGVTEAGLTAAAVQEETLGSTEWTLKAGTLVLADMGLACVDEIDKMDKNDTDALHEAMEQQTISIDKAGKHATFNARCSVLAASNPTDGRFEPHRKIADQIDLSPPLISRFDLIYIVRDIPKEGRDEELAEHILSLHQDGERKLQDESHEPEKRFTPTIEEDMMKKYIAYAKTLHPYMPSDLKDELKEFYVELRSKGGEGQNVPITARQLESLVRMAEASARLHLREEVTEKDVQIAEDTLMDFLEHVVTDEDGRMDIDRMETGISCSDRTKRQTIRDILHKHEDTYENGMPIGQLEKEAEDEGINPVELRKVLEKMNQQGQTYSPEYDHYDLVD